jgi:hypothetical protein
MLVCPAAVDLLPIQGFTLFVSVWGISETAIASATAPILESARSGRLWFFSLAVYGVSVVEERKNFSM